MHKHFKNIPVLFNNRNFLVEDISISSEIQLTPQYIYDNSSAQIELPSSMWNGSCKVSYYLTGADYLKQFIYSTVNEPISGNIAGLYFNQGYLSNYSLSLEPNSPVLVNATISVYDKITGNLTNINSINKTGLILRTSDVSIDNLSGYTKFPINNYLKINFNYSNNIIPSINYFDTGSLPSQVDNVFIQEKTITTEIYSDDTHLDVPLSGEKFGLLINMSNPYNTGIYETFGCSGLASSKELSISSNGISENILKITQHHTNPNGYIYSVQTGINNLTINFNTGAFPLSGRDGTLNYVDKIFIGDTEVTGFSVNRTANYDQVISPIPFSVNNDSLTIYTSYGNFIYPNKIYFPYNNITITGLSYNTGYAGNNIIISGTNFVRISDAFFGGYTRGQFQVLNPQTIQATIPANGLTNPIIVESNGRGLSGASPSNFFYQPSINNISPVTGVWKDTIVISGNNFTGTTGVYFGNIKAFSFNTINNNTINAQAPETGAGYASGYISIYSTGGFTQSYSRYNPIVPIYSFNPSSGIPGTAITINTKIDTGYLYPLSGGYKTRIGGQDTIFYLSGANSTGALTGLLPNNSSDDYIYLYQPNGISSSASTTKFDVVGFPTISYISPVYVNQYKYFNLLMIGNSLEYFNSSSFLAFSGGVSGDYQSYGTGTFTASLDGKTLLAQNINLTGSTGYYNVSINNIVSGYILTSGLFLDYAVNQAQNASASVTQSPIAPYVGSYAIDGSTGTFAAVIDEWHTGVVLKILPNKNSYFDVSYININPSYTKAVSNWLPILPEGTIITVYNLYPPTGSIRYYRGGTALSNVFLKTDNIIMSGANLYPSTGILTGITRIDIYPPEPQTFIPSSYYLPIIEVNIY